MEHNWQDITDTLYENIDPYGGEIFSRIDQTFKQRKGIKTSWIEFDMNDFIYIDPFYGEQLSTSTFRMNVSLSEFLENNNVDSILQLANQTIDGNKTDRIGAFSNSLAFTIPQMKFGQLNDDKTIEFEMTYCLTNSDSYGRMTGSINDHIENSGHLKTSLQIKELLVFIPISKNIKRVTKKLNSMYYDIHNAYEAKDLNWSKENYKSYYVPYSNGQYKIQPWWRRLFRK